MATIQSYKKQLSAMPNELDEDEIAGAWIDAWID